MGVAFVTKNPMLPDDFFQAPTLDDFVEGLNKQVEYSLLDCPGRFTVRVASFYGYASSEMLSHRVKGSDKTTDALDMAAAKANKLTLELRKKGVDAYQFHDRIGSYVMIGSFDQLGQEVGKQFNYDSRIVKIMQDWCGYRTITNSRTGLAKQTVNSLAKIPFDLDGKPMAVPKRNTSKLYGGSLLGGR